MAIRQPIITIAGHVDHGKCVAGDTKIPLADGSIVEAKKLFEKHYHQSKAEHKHSEIVQEVIDEGIVVNSFDGRSMIKANVSHIWKRRADVLIEVKTASGETIKTTPEHPFFTTGYPDLKEVEAEDLEEGDYIAVPKYISSEESDFREVIIEKLKVIDDYVCFVNHGFDLSFKGLLNSNMKEIEKDLGIRNLQDSITKRRFRLKDLFKLASYYDVGGHEIYSMISKVKNVHHGWMVGHTSKPMSLPVDGAEKLGYVLGCIAGDGHIGRNNVILHNNDPEIQQVYSNYLKDLFGLETKIRAGRTCEQVIDKGGMTFSRFMTDIIGFPGKGKSTLVSVPETAQTNKDVFKGFFAGLIDTDGYVSHINHCLEITSKSRELVRQSAISLLRFGIQSVIFQKNGYHYLRISNKLNLQRFLKSFRPRLKRKLQRIIDAAGKAKSSRIFDFLPVEGRVLKNLLMIKNTNKMVPYFNKYVTSGSLSHPFLASLVENLGDASYYSEMLKHFLISEVSYVKVISTRIVPNEDGFVYDFTVPETNNFVAERVLVHNTSILDCFRGSAVAEGEAGGITQKISFTKYPAEQVRKACPLIERSGIKLQIPGFMFIDTPGHAAFTNLRRRGGSLADLAVLVVDIKEGIKPQTAEVISILQAHKTPFVIALNKVDTISGWQKKKSIKESIASLPAHVRQEFDVALLTFQGALQNHGYDSELYYDVKDFTKHVAIVPTSARTQEGIPELLFVLAGLSQKFLQDRLRLSEAAEGVILEIKKEKAMEHVEAILYDGTLKSGDMIAVATLAEEPLVGKVRALEEILPLSHHYQSKGEATAATGIRIQLTNKENLLPGMPFKKVKENVEEVKRLLQEEVSETVQVEKQGIIVKADSLGSLEALLTLLKQANVSVVKAGIGPITKADIISAKANLDINPLDAVVVGFNVEPEEEIAYGRIKVFSDDVVYKLIEDLDEWRKEKHSEMEKERLMGLATITKLEVLPQHVFRNSNPAIFGVRIVAGALKKHLPLIDENDNNIASVKAVQSENHSVDEAGEGKEVAISLPGTNYERQIMNPGIRFLYSQMSESQFRKFKQNRDLLSSNELKVLQEIADIKRKKKEEWGV